MKEGKCLFLMLEAGAPQDGDIPSVTAEAKCLATDEKDCPKARLKFQISPWCWRTTTGMIVRESEKV